MSDQDSGLGLDVTLTQTEPIALNVHLTCRRSELLALVGPSGGGKTTVLRAIAGLLRPKSGHVKANGETWFQSSAGIFMPPQQRRVGFVFQDYALFPHLSVIDNVAVALPVADRAVQRTRAAEILQRVNLEGLEDRSPATLSGGQRQRVALARALARQPAVLLLDEPFSAVDQMTRERLKRELALLRASLDIPIVLVTHDMGEALALADRVSVLYRGTIVATATPEDMRLRPPSPLVARLMGEPNVFEGTLETAAASDCAGWLRSAGHRLAVGSTGDFRSGEAVQWLIPSDYIVLQRPGRNSAGDGENPVRGTVIEAVGLGDRLIITMRIADSDLTLSFKVASHTWRRNELSPGTHITVSLLAEGIHLMRADGHERGAHG